VAAIWPPGWALYLGNTRLAVNQRSWASVSAAIRTFENFLSMAQDRCSSTFIGGNNHRSNHGRETQSCRTLTTEQR
jgi:hypothetical protein